MDRYKLFILVFFYQVLFSQKQFVIDATVSTEYDGSVVYYYFNNADKVTIDSTIIKNGKFSFKGSTDYPTLFTIYKKPIGDDEKENYSFFTSSGKTKLSLNYLDFSLSKIERNKYQDEFLKYNEYKKVIWKKLEKNNQLRDKLEEKNISSHDITNQIYIQKLDSIQNNIEEESIRMDIEYAKKNPSSFIALYQIYFDLGRSLGRSKYKEIKYAFDLMSADTKKSSLGIYINDKLNSLKDNSKVGGSAINFESEDLFGNKFSLSDFFGKKVIILDFWASWCAPCKMQLPFFRKIYRQYKEAGLEIISISRDSKYNVWRNTVEKEKMEWINVLIKDGTKKILDSYAAQAIPVTVIIDRKGKVIGRWTGFSEESNNEIEKIISENLK